MEPMKLKVGQGHSDKKVITRFPGCHAYLCGNNLDIGVPGNNKIYSFQIGQTHLIDDEYIHYKFDKHKAGQFLFDILFLKGLQLSNCFIS